MSRRLALALALAAPARPAGAQRFEPLSGFRVETVAEGIGSLIALARGPRGELWVSVEGGGVLRLEDGDGDGSAEKVTPETDAVVNVQGLHGDEAALWLVGEGRPGGYGLYRLDRTTRALERRLGFEVQDPGHGAHAVVPGPDGRLWVALGNHARLAEPEPQGSPYAIAYEGHLGRFDLDPRGFGDRVRSPGGTIVAYDPRGGPPRVMAGGLRNVYDFAFNGNGDLIACDSDMEWDIGLPWYRPVKAIHVVPGGEYGSRTGSRVWPEWYPDQVGAVLEIGRGSPTGMVRYDAASFPARLQGAFLVGDWAKGEILALHLEPRGASYGGRIETLLSGRPLNVCDLALEPSGSVLFVTGGRGSLGGVYRLVWDGPLEHEREEPFVRPERPVRFTGLTPVAELVAALDAEDRLVRYLAGRELERRDPADWEATALAARSPLARAEALVALARTALWRDDGEAALCRRLGAALDGLPGTRSAEARRVLLRAIELLLLAPHAPADALGDALGRELLALWPTRDVDADRELVLLLSHLAPEGAAAALVEAFRRETRPVERIHLAYGLRRLERGWPDGARLEVASWLEEARRLPGGSSYPGYLEFLIRDVARGLTREEADRLARLRPAPSPAPAARPAATPPQAGPSPAQRAGPPPPSWTAGRLVRFLDRALGAPHRSPAEGALVFARACASCHRFGASRGGPGPDLTTAGRRFAVADLVENLLEPSKVIADGYRSVVVRTRAGNTIEGMPALDDGRTLELLLADGTTARVATADIVLRREAARSLMPEGLVEGLTLEELADLFAFLLAARPVPPPAASAWTRLFDGATLRGLSGDPALWRADGGTILGRARDLARASDLVLPGAPADFLLEVDVHLPAGNSGIDFRARRTGDFALEGLQADAGSGHWGELYAHRLGTVARPTAEALAAAGVDPAGWNHVLLDVEGTSVRLELNGVTTVEWVDPAPRAGRIGLQLHGAGRTEVRLRNLRLRPRAGR